MNRISQESSCTSVPARVACALLGLLLVLLLAACGGGGGSGGGNSTTVSSAPASDSTATTGTSDGSGNGSTLQNAQTYQGDGYTMEYPDGWTAKSAQNGGTLFSNSDGSLAMNVLISPDTNSDLTTTQAGDQMLQNNEVKFTNVQQNQVDPTVQLAGETWAQRAFTGTDSQGTTLTELLVVSIHTANGSTNLYQVAMLGTPSTFDQSTTDYFRPMLQSFAFTS